MNVSTLHGNQTSELYFIKNKQMKRKERNTIGKSGKMEEEQDGRKLVKEIIILIFHMF